MKIYNLPVIECKLLLDSTVTNDILTKLYKDINNKKNKLIMLDINGIVLKK